MKRTFPQRVKFGMKLGLRAADARELARLSTPEKIQDFVTALRINHEKDGDSCLSVAQVLKHRHAHCIEGAFVAAAALWMAGSPPLLMDMRAARDQDHVVTLFRARGGWGAISKSNHVWLRWRDPVYKSLRELAMSYFHEYVNDRRKTLRAYSVPFDLRRFEPQEWMTNEKNCWGIAEALDDSRHFQLLTPAQAKRLKTRDAMEMKAGKMKEYKGA